MLVCTSNASTRVRAVARSRAAQIAGSGTPPGLSLNTALRATAYQSLHAIALPPPPDAGFVLLVPTSQNMAALALGIPHIGRDLRHGVPRRMHLLHPLHYTTRILVSSLLQTGGVASDHTTEPGKKLTFIVLGI